MTTQLNWLSTAPCRADADAMFPGTAAETEHAKSFCRRCPAIERCRDWALTAREIYGVWGGLDEDERWEIFRQTGRVHHRAAQPAGPRPPAPASLRELFDRHASPSTGGHMVWIGAKTPIFQSRQLTPNQVAFMADRGREPDGPVKRLCEVKGCVQPKHLIDTAERTQCGTRPGYRRHRDRGEEACDDCKQANADADNRLRWTGTTKAAA